MLSDLGLPTAAAWISCAPSRQGHELPAIAISGFGQEQDIQQTRSAGFFAHLTKPVSLPKLKEAIARATPLHVAEGAGAASPVAARAIVLQSEISESQN